MSNGNRNYRSSTLEAFFVCLILIGVAATIFATGRTFGVDAGRNEITARQHYNSEKQSALTACAGADPAHLSECIVDAVESAQSQSETRQDLYAQQDMSDWAFWMMLTSLGMFFVSLLGVIWIKGTLDETRRVVSSADDAVKATREIGKAQVRAYLSFDITKIDFRKPNLSSVPLQHP